MQAQAAKAHQSATASPERAKGPGPLAATDQADLSIWLMHVSRPGDAAPLEAAPASTSNGANPCPSLSSPACSLPVCPGRHGTLWMGIHRKVLHNGIYCSSGRSSYRSFPSLPSLSLLASSGSSIIVGSFLHSSCRGYTLLARAW